MYKFPRLGGRVDSIFNNLTTWQNVDRNEGFGIFVNLHDSMGETSILEFRKNWVPYKTETNFSNQHRTLSGGARHDVRLMAGNGSELRERVEGVRPS